MKTLIRIISIILISTLLILNVPLYSKAAISFDEILDSGDDFLNTNDEDAVATAPSEEKLAEISDTVSGVLLTIALGVTLISAIVMGINFTIQSVEDRAKIKESMIPWIIGIFISFGAFGIWKLTMNVFYNL